MINKLIDGIVAKIREADFSCNIYQENIPQNFKTPCFCIENVSASRDYRFMGQSENNTLICVKYFPKNKNEARNECLEVCEALYQTLEYIPIHEHDRNIRGVKRNSRIVDDVLNFFVTYNFFTRIETIPIESMETLTEKGVKING